MGCNWIGSTGATLCASRPCVTLTTQSCWLADFAIRPNAGMPLLHTTQPAVLCAAAAAPKHST
jgi:hypothetical protein